MAKASKPVGKKTSGTPTRKRSSASTAAKKTATPRKTAAKPAAAKSAAATAADAKVETSTAVTPSEMKKQMEESGKPAPEIAKEEPSTFAAKSQGTPAKEAASATENRSAAPAATTPASPPPPAAQQGSSFWPLFFGGVLAAILGFLASELDMLGTRGDTESLRAGLDQQGARLSELEKAEVPAMPEVTFPALDDLTTEVTALSGTLDDIDARLTAVEKRPITGGSSQEAVAAYERELAALQASVEEQRTEIEGLLNNALSVEEATADAARTTRLQAAMTELANAINSGQPFDAPLARLSEDGVSDVPAALSDVAADGVKTLNDLQTRFPDTARTSLGAARASGSDDGESGFGGFLRRQLGARSVTPREGNGPDAVLSRTEAAVREGRLNDALAEIEALPAPAQEAMKDWLDDARARYAAETASKDLSQSLTAN